MSVSQLSSTVEAGVFTVFCERPHRLTLVAIRKSTMKESKKHSKAEIVAVVLCALGCLLLVGQAFIETEFDLFSIALALNGLGIVAFLFGRGTEKADQVAKK
jgi:hypothetical protein